eukprot:2878173-Prymnesium_polylepis.1
MESALRRQHGLNRARPSALSTSLGRRSPSTPRSTPRRRRRSRSSCSLSWRRRLSSCHRRPHRPAPFRASARSAPLP